MRHYRFHVAVRCAVPTVATLLTSAEADGNAHTVATVETVERIIYVKDVVWVKQQYKLMYNEGYADYYGSDIVEIGKIVDTSLNEDVMFIYYEKELYKRTGCHTCIEEYEREGRDYPVAIDNCFPKDIWSVEYCLCDSTGERADSFRYMVDGLRYVSDNKYVLSA